MPALADTLDPHVAPSFATSALVVVDVQVDFLDGGASPIAGTTEVLPCIARLLAAYRAAGRPIVHVVRLYAGEDVDRVRRGAIAAGARLVRPGTPGSQIAPALLPEPGVELDAAALTDGALQAIGPGEAVLWKPRWSAFHRTPLHEHLSGLGVDTVVVAGCNFPNCPRATVTDASALDYRVAIAADAISGVLPLHLEEADRIGVVHADTATLVERVGAIG